MDMTEEQFTRRVVIPLLHRLGFKRIRYVHGSDEHGRDILFTEFDRFGVRLICAAQVKAGDIRGTQKSLIQKQIVPQLLEGLKTPYRDPDTGETVQINRMYLVLSGTLLGTAKDQFHAAFEHEPNILILDRNTIDLYYDRDGIETVFTFVSSRDLSGPMYGTGHSPRNPMLPLMHAGTTLAIALSIDDDTLIEEIEVLRVSYSPLFKSQEVYLYVPIPNSLQGNKDKCHEFLGNLHQQLHSSIDDSTEVFLELLEFDATHGT